MIRRCLPTPSAIALLAIAGLLGNPAASASTVCPEQQPTLQVPKNLALCKMLESAVRHPSALPLNEYEDKLSQFFNNLCQRDTAAGWVSDKYIRDTGPWTGTYSGGKWMGTYFGTHAPVMVWYSPDFYKWLKANRPEHGAPANPAPIPDGAMVVKEMYSVPAAACAGVEQQYLIPNQNGAAIMVRDSQVAQDGWFWGWYGWPGSVWKVDWPAAAGSPSPNMGFGQYCVNCHASAKDNQTFASLTNIKGEPGEPLVFLSQDFFLNPSWLAAQTSVAPSGAPPLPAPALIDDVHVRLMISALEQRKAEADKPAPPPYKPAFLGSYSIALGAQRPGEVAAMPPATYDNVWVKAGTVAPASQFITSDQCVGCHSAGGTGLQFDMTEPATDTLLRNISPYGTWRGSPMGLAGRDPVFFAQLASETEKFHPDFSPVVQDTCLGCHGILGQRQFGIDMPKKDNKCQPFLRTGVNAVPYPADDPVAKLAAYGGLARDGISCAACHHMVLGQKDSDKFMNAPQNECVKERQAFLNPGLTKSAATFTGSFFVGPPDRLYGPFDEPKTMPMKHSLGIEPAFDHNIKSSELCGSCHSVHLPVMHGDKIIGMTYEQTTYPEWAFSAYRTGTSPDGDLPSGSGSLAQSCQDCHMPNKDKAGNLYRSKIASIQEHKNFPEAEHTLAPKDIDVPVRAGFAKHTLVGLNLILLKMANQFSDLLGIRQADPMLGSKGINSISASEEAMLDQALNRTAQVVIDDVKEDKGSLSAKVTVNSLVGHKFPSGVGFRRAFIEFDVLDSANNVLWASGRANGSGIITDEKGAAVAGELWWKSDCSERIDPQARIHQPHYQELTRQNEVQIYQELVSTPPNMPPQVCGPHAKPAGQLTTSFLSICAKVKDNRLLPHGFLSLGEREKIAVALGAKADMAEDTDPVGVGDDPDYKTGGGDSLIYNVPLAALAGKAKPASVQATLYYQPTPPFFLQDRYCTSHSADTQRLYYIAGKLNLANSATQDWKVRIVTSGPVSVP